MLPPAWVLVAVYIALPGELHTEVSPDMAWKNKEGCESYKSSVLEEVKKRQEIVAFGMECVQLPIRLQEGAAEKKYAPTK